MFTRAAIPGTWRWRARFRWSRRPAVPSLRITVMAAALLAGLAAAGEAGAATKHVIREPIHQHLERTPDEGRLCGRKGMSMNRLVLFIPTATTAVPVYWHGPSDRFVQYPGTTACTVWKRIGT